MRRDRSSADDRLGIEYHSGSPPRVRAQPAADLRLCMQLRTKPQSSPNQFAGSAANDLL